MPRRGLHLRFTLPLLSFLLCGVSLSAHAGLRIQGRQFVDERGARVLLRGFSLASKMPPFRPVSGAADLDVLQEAGVNLLRLHFSWEAAESERGQYDESYFEYYDQLVEWAWEREIYVIIDFHNNAFSRYAAEGCGSGFPAWAITPEAQTWEPRENGSCLFIYRMTKAVWFGEDNFLTWRDFLENNYGARDRFFSLSRRLAAKYADHPTVIGFDLNEPLPYDTKQGQFAYGLMSTFYEAWAEVIHREMPKAMILVEPFATDHVGAKQPPPMRKPAIANLVYAPHLYEPGSLMFGFPITGYSNAFQSIVARGEQWHVPVLIGEWGAREYGWRASLDLLDHLVRDMDAQGISAARWVYAPDWTPETLDRYHDEDYSCFDDQRVARPACRQRAYVQVLSGVERALSIQHRGEARYYAPWLTWLTGLFRFDATRIELSWDHDPDLGETRIFANRALLFEGAKVQIESAGKGLHCAYDAAERFVLCASPHAGTMRVSIAPDE